MRWLNLVRDKRRWIVGSQAISEGRYDTKHKHSRQVAIAVVGAADDDDDAFKYNVNDKENEILYVLSNWYMKEQVRLK
jgi:hypothetical protein